MDGAFRQTRGAVQPAWICGDAGLWHFGRRERGHMLLLPPILTRDSARELAQGIIRLREHTGLEVLPENPPGHVFVGDLHLLDFFALVLDEADTGMLLDAAHLAIYQQVMGHDPLTGLDGFPAALSLRHTSQVRARLISVELGLLKTTIRWMCSARHGPCHRSWRAATALRAGGLRMRT